MNTVAMDNHRDWLGHRQEHRPRDRCCGGGRTRERREAFARDAGPACLAGPPAGLARRLRQHEPGPEDPLRTAGRRGDAAAAAVTDLPTSQARAAAISRHRRQSISATAQRTKGKYGISYQTPGGGQQHHAVARMKPIDSGDAEQSPDARDVSQRQRSNDADACRAQEANHQPGVGADAKAGAKVASATGAIVSPEDVAAKRRG